MVDGISNKSLGAPVLRFAKSDPAGRASDAAPVSTSAPAAPKAEISSAALEAADAGSPPLDTAKIARVKQAIADGAYTIDHEKIAAKMLELDLGWTQEQ